MTKDERLRFCATKRLLPAQRKLVIAAENLAILQQKMLEATHILTVAKSLIEPVNLKAIIYTEQKRRKARIRNYQVIIPIAEKKTRKLKKDSIEAWTEAKKLRIRVKEITIENIRKTDHSWKVGSFLGPDGINISVVWGQQLYKAYCLDDQYRDSAERLAALKAGASTLSIDFFAGLRGRKQTIESIQAAAEQLHKEAQKNYRYAARAYAHFYKNVKDLRYLYPVYISEAMATNEFYKIGFIDYMLSHPKDYPGAEEWIHEILHNSILRVSSKTKTYQIYFGGINEPCGKNHGHIAMPFRIDGSLDPKAKPYFRPPGPR